MSLGLLPQFSYAVDILFPGDASPMGETTLGFLGEANLLGDYY